MTRVQSGGKVPPLVLLGGGGGRQGGTRNERKRANDEATCPLISMQDARRHGSSIGMLSAVTLNNAQGGRVVEDSNAASEWGPAYMLGYYYSALTSVARIIGIPTMHMYLKQFDAANEDVGFVLALLPAIAIVSTILQSQIFRFLEGLLGLKMVYVFSCISIGGGALMVFLALPHQQISWLYLGYALMGMGGGNQVFLQILKHHPVSVSRTRERIARYDSRAMQFAMAIAFFLASLCISFETRVNWNDQINVRVPKSPSWSYYYEDATIHPPPPSSPPPPSYPSTSLLGETFTGINVPYLIVTAFAATLAVFSILTWPEKTSGSSPTGSEPLPKDDLPRAASNANGDAWVGIITILFVASAVSLKILAFYELENGIWGYPLQAITLLSALLEAVGSFMTCLDSTINRCLTKPRTSSRDAVQVAVRSNGRACYSLVVRLVMAGFLFALWGAFRAGSNTGVSITLYLVAALGITTLSRNMYAVATNKVMRAASKPNNSWWILLSGIAVDFGYAMGFLIATDSWFILIPAIASLVFSFVSFGWTICSSGYHGFGPAAATENRSNSALRLVSPTETSLSAANNSGNDTSDTNDTSDASD